MKTKILAGFALAFCVAFGLCAQERISKLPGNKLEVKNTFAAQTGIVWASLLAVLDDGRVEMLSFQEESGRWRFSNPARYFRDTSPTGPECEQIIRDFLLELLTDPYPLQEGARYTIRWGLIDKMFNRPLIWSLTPTVFVYSRDMDVKAVIRGEMAKMEHSNWYATYLPIYAPDVKWVAFRIYKEDTGQCTARWEDVNGANGHPDVLAHAGDGYIYLQSVLLASEHSYAAFSDRGFYTLYYDEAKTDWDTFDVSYSGKKIASSRENIPPTLDMYVTKKKNIRAVLVACVPGREYAFHVSQTPDFREYEELVSVADANGITFIEMSPSEMGFVRTSDNPSPTARRVDPKTRR